MVKVSIDYVGGLHCVATHGPSKSTLETDAPVDNNGKGERFSPTDLVGTALGTCMSTVMGIVAERNGIDLKGMHVDVVKEMSSDSPRRIRKLSVDIHIPLPADHPKRDLLERAALGCPVHHSLHPDVEKPINFHWKS